jgi:hypothetical protein
VNSSPGFGAGLVVFFVVYGVVILGSLAMLIVALVDIVKRPDWQWKLAGQEKVVWILSVILVNFLAILPLVYWLNIRKKLIAVERAAAAGQYGPGHMTYSGWEPTPPSFPPPGWHPDPSAPVPLVGRDSLDRTHLGREHADLVDPPTAVEQSRAEQSSDRDRTVRGGPAVED